MLAILGREADWDTLASVARVDAAGLRGRLRTAALAGVVTVGPTHVRFAHVLSMLERVDSWPPSRKREPRLVSRSRLDICPVGATRNA